jgi:hypothetical protein
MQIFGSAPRSSTMYNRPSPGSTTSAAMARSMPIQPITVIVTPSSASVRASLSTSARSGVSLAVTTITCFARAVTPRSWSRAAVSAASMSPAARVDSTRLLTAFDAAFASTGASGTSTSL